MWKSYLILDLNVSIALIFCLLIVTKEEKEYLLRYNVKYTCPEFKLYPFKAIAFNNQSIKGEESGSSIFPPAKENCSGRIEKTDSDSAFWITQQLLMQAGDVETNPGPTGREGEFIIFWGVPIDSVLIREVSWFQSSNAF